MDKKYIHHQWWNYILLLQEKTQWEHYFPWFNLFPSLPPSLSFPSPPLPPSPAPSLTGRMQFVRSCNPTPLPWPPSGPYWYTFLTWREESVVSTILRYDTQTDRQTDRQPLTSPWQNRGLAPVACESFRSAADKQAASSWPSTRSEQVFQPASTTLTM